MWYASLVQLIVGEGAVAGKEKGTEKKQTKQTMIEKNERTVQRGVAVTVAIRMSSCSHLQIFLNFRDADG